MKKKSLCFNNNANTKEECSLQHLCDSGKCCYFCQNDCSIRCDNDYITCEHKCNKYVANKLSVVSKKRLDVKKKN